MRRILRLTGRVLWLALALIVGAHWVGQAQQPPAAADDPRFTGRSDQLEPTGLALSRRRFDAGARSAWHSHANGQLLFVEQGRARVQRRGESMKELGRGESDYTAGKVVHWHGAAPREPFVQVAVGFGGETTWLQKVTDDEYAGKSK
ncbi:MAG: cupin domain-containing protein [Luteitalea sp.]|nr:cupin domain-containing protein [Luteitalea sp.]